MRNFGSLSEGDQKSAIHHCINLIVRDMLDSDTFELNSDDKCEGHQNKDKELEKHINMVIKEAKELPEEEQAEYILQDQDSGEIIFDIALGMARDAWFPEDSELVIFTSSFVKEAGGDNINEMIDIIVEDENLKKLN